MHVLAKNEMGFLKIIVKPLWEALNETVKQKLGEALENIERNIEQWNLIYTNLIEE